MPYIDRSPLEYPTNTTRPLDVRRETRAPIDNQDGLKTRLLTLWHDTFNENVYILVVSTTTTSVWKLVASASSLYQIAVDAFTGPGTNPVLPTGAGLVTFTGAQVVSGTVGANVIRTDSLAASSVTFEIQQAGSAAAQDTTLNGVAHFDSAHFTVTNGFVQLAGGGTAIDQIAVDASTPPGTNPVVPDGTGQVTITGAQVATGTVGANVIRTNSTAANTLAIEIQRTTTAAATDSTLNGVCHFDSASFSVDANGFVTLGSSAGVSLSPYIVGATNSDFTSIQDAIDQAESDGASNAAPANIYIKAGTYTENLTITNPGINLIGFTPYSTGGSNPGIVNIATLSSVTLEGNITIQNSSAANISISNIELQSFTNPAFTCNNTAALNLTITGCRADGSISPSANAENLDFIGSATVTLVVNNSYFRSGATGLNVINSIANSISVTIFLNSATFIGGGVTTVIGTTSTLNLYTSNSSLQNFGTTSTGFTLLQITSENSFSVFTINTSGRVILAARGGSLGGSIISSASNSLCTISDALIALSIEYSGASATTLISNCVDSSGREYFKSYPAYLGSQFLRAQDSVQTTNATITTIGFVAVNEEESITLKGQVIGAQDDHSNAVGGTFEIVARRALGGSLTLVGTAIVNVQSSSAATFTVAVVSNTIAIRVTGVAATTYNWVTTFEYQKVLTEA